MDHRLFQSTSSGMMDIRNQFREKEDHHCHSLRNTCAWWELKWSQKRYVNLLFSSAKEVPFNILPNQDNKSIFVCLFVHLVIQRTLFMLDYRFAIPVVYFVQFWTSSLVQYQSSTRFNFLTSLYLDVPNISSLKCIKPVHISFRNKVAVGQTRCS